MHPLQPGLHLPLYCNASGAVHQKPANRTGRAYRGICQAPHRAAEESRVADGQ